MDAKQETEFSIHPFDWTLNTSLLAHPSEIDEVFVLDNGDFVTLDTDKKLRVWNRKDRTYQRFPDFIGDEIEGVERLPNNQLLCSSEHWRYLYVLDIAKRERIIIHIEREDVDEFLALRDGRIFVLLKTGRASVIDLEKKTCTNYTVAIKCCIGMKELFTGTVLIWTECEMDFVDVKPK